MFRRLTQGPRLYPASANAALVGSSPIPVLSYYTNSGILSGVLGMQLR